MKYLFLKSLGDSWKRPAAILSLLIVAMFLTKQMFFSSANDTEITAVVTRMDLEQTVFATGSVKAFKQVNVGAQVTGQITKLNVVLGQKVHQGMYWR